jgi:hypothetical protein
MRITDHPRDAGRREIVWKLLRTGQPPHHESRVIAAYMNGQKLYLAAGGSDFLAEFDKGTGGERSWVRDTSGSAQAVAVLFVSRSNG